MLQTLVEEFLFLKQATTKDKKLGTKLCVFLRGQRTPFYVTYLQDYFLTSKASFYDHQTDKIIHCGLGYCADDFTPEVFLRVYPPSTFSLEPYHYLYLVPISKSLIEKLAFRLRCVLTSW